MKKFLSFLLLTGLLLGPQGQVSASEQSVLEEELTLQLQAIYTYIEQLYGTWDQTPQTTDELRESIIEASDWIKTAQEDSGHFKYEYVPYEDSYLGQDHSVRQAGSLFELGELARRDPNDTLELSETIERAIGFFETLSKKDTKGEESFHCITDRPSTQRCQLGATSLALAGILGYLEQHPEQKAAHEERIESYVSYILSAKKAGGGFRNYHSVNGNWQNPRESSFSNGEALLALVRYYQFNPREDVKTVIDDTFEYLETTEFDFGLYLWIMAALKDMYTLWPNDEYLTYAKAYTDWRIDSAARNRNTERNYCAYSEGIVSAYSLLEESLSELERSELRNEIDYWNTKNAHLQIQENPYKVAVVDGTLTIQKLKNPERARGGFLTAHNELTERIDFTQHCISANLQTLVDIEGESL